MIRRLFAFPWRTRRSIRTDVDAELGFHMDARTEALVAEGLDPAAARAQALKEFGDVEDARRFMTTLDANIESARRRRDYMGDLKQDITYALRKLRASPTFAITAILTLAVGIGANTAVFNLVNAVLFRPPPVREPSQLAWIAPRDKNGRFGQWDMPDYEVFRTSAKSWSGLFAFSAIDVTLTDDNPVHVAGQIVSANYFDVLGVQPRPGRGFVAREDSVVAGSVPVVIGFAFWQAHYAGDSGLVGRTVIINAHPMTVVGIAPEGFNGMRLGDDVGLWLPLSSLETLYGARKGIYTQPGSRWLAIIGRIAPASNMEAASAEAAMLSSRFEPDITKAEDRRTVAVMELKGGLDPQARHKIAPTLAALMLVPLFILGIACANVANLFVARSVQREKEIAVRRALGASRGRLVRQLLTECMVLGVASGMAGIAVSYLLTAIVSRVGDFPSDIMSILHPDPVVFVATIVLAIAAGAVFGLLPSLAATGNSITPSLKNDGIAPVSSGARHRLRNGFVISQVALSLSLLITAGLFVGSLQKALTVNPGFDSRNAVGAVFDLAAQGYDTARAKVFMQELIERLTNDAAVQAVTYADLLPLSGSSSGTAAVAEGAPPDAPGSTTYTAVAGPNFFTAMRIPIIKGRPFAESDNASSPRVGIVNERLAEFLWPGEDAVGKRFHQHGDSTLLTVIGVTRNGKYRTLAEEIPMAYYWIPSTQVRQMSRAVVMVRSGLSTEAGVQALRRTFKAIDPGVPLFRERTLENGIAQTVDGQRAGAAMLGVSGALALGLAALGIFGVIAHGVTTRRREIGIRMSLGARAQDVVAAFVREGLGLTAIGAAIGIVMSVALSKLMESMLFGLTATDTLTFAGASAALVGVAALASFLPARRAAKVDPLVALRSD